LEESLELYLLIAVKGRRGGWLIAPIPKLAGSSLLGGDRWDNLLGLCRRGGDVVEVLGGGDCGRPYPACG
jgi:hypothetical protein